MAEHLAHTELNRRRIAEVESRFGASGQPLALPGRVLLGEGVLTKECRRGAQPRAFFLFSDVLVYGSLVLGGLVLRAQRVLPLEEVRLEPLPDTPRARHRWLIRSERKSFAVSAASAPERRAWMSRIEEGARRQRRATGRPEEPSAELAAPWVPDQAADICMRCTRTRFSALTRRHHCRRCGFVVCGGCSRARVLLPRLAPKPQRVCGLCYRQLAAQRPQAGGDGEEAAGQGAGSPSGAGAGCGVSSGDEDDDDSEEDKEGGGEGDWPGRVRFYDAGVSWSSFHS